MPDQCLLCKRPKDSGVEFCDLHEKASKGLEESYSLWNRAFGGKLARKEYFVRLTRLDETGSAVKDIIKHKLAGEG
jgi:hypothetical protein